MLTKGLRIAGPMCRQAPGNGLSHCDEKGGPSEMAGAWKVLDCIHWHSQVQEITAVIVSSLMIHFCYIHSSDNLTNQHRSVCCFITVPRPLTNNSMVAGANCKMTVLCSPPTACTVWKVCSKHASIAASPAVMLNCTTHVHVQVHCQEAWC